MAFELTDFFRSYTKRGEFRGLLNVARSDESADSPRYYLYLNEVGAYVIQKIVDDGSGIKTYTYYGAGKGKADTTMTADWTNRASLTYVEYHLLFEQGQT